MTDIKIKGSTAYVEIFKRDGQPVARLNHFDRDVPLTRVELLAYLHGLQESCAKLAEMETVNMTTLEGTLHRAAAEFATWPAWKRSTFGDHK